MLRPRGLRIRREIASTEFAPSNTSVTFESFLSYYNKTELNVSAFDPKILNYTAGKINVTGTTFILSGLPHFSEYHIMVGFNISFRYKEIFGN